MKLQLNTKCSVESKLPVTAGFAILGQKQYPSALVRYWAVVRAEVFQSSFVLYLYICFSIGQRFRAEDFQIPQHRKALSLVAIFQRHSTMRQIFLIIFTLTTLNSNSQKLDITNIEKSKVLTTLLDSESKSKILTQLNCRQDNTLRKKWTARTFLLSDGKIVIEFYDKQAILIDNLNDFKKLERIKFVKIFHIKLN
jgi:hypothetical protein